MRLRTATRVAPRLPQLKKSLRSNKDPAKQKSNNNNNNNFLLASHYS